MAPQHDQASASPKDRLSETKERVAEQYVRIASLEPSTDEHRIATNVLLLMTDSLHVLSEANRMIQLLKISEAQ